MQRNSGSVLRIDWAKRSIEFFEQFKVALFHLAVLTMIHPIEGLRRLAEVVAVVVGNRTHLRL